MPTIECTIVETVVFKRSKEGPLYLILRRSASESLYPGTWQIITGTIEQGESAVAAALREIGEETSLSLERFWAVPLVGSFFQVGTDSVQLCPQFAAEVAVGAEPTLSQEHQGFQWVAMDQAIPLLVWPGHHRAIETVHRFIVAEQEAARLTEINLEKVERKMP